MNLFVLSVRFLSAIGALVLLVLQVQCTSIVPVPTVAFTDHRHTMLFSDLEFQDPQTGTQYVVPAGFVSDYASIPLSLRQYFETGGEAYQYPAIVHDWLYWSQITTREEADRIFDSAMKECGVGDVKRRSLWAGVRAGGGGPWEVNRKERKKGLLKVIPEPYRQPKTWPRNVSWPAYRQWLFDQGVR